ncbi:SixA phosphatase family protein [Roseibium sp.]|uniref:SixA phosphatase family protein n=1 Tax=Roseibium sp. TaxID=1936156 RepID=UPI003A97A01D
MLRLLLLRHAKSDWSNPALDDFDRPLNQRGEKVTEVMAEYINETCPPPDLILCSTSVRTRQTLKGLLDHIAVDTDIQLRGELYEDSEEDYLPLLQNLDSVAETVLLIGHNPATEDTASRLYGTGSQVAFADLSEKYPTGALTVLTFPISRWTDLREGSGTLERFIKPRDLMDATD